MNNTTPSPLPLGAIEHEFDARYWARAWGLSRDGLSAVIRAAGSRRVDDIARFLGKDTAPGHPAPRP